MGIILILLLIAAIYTTSLRYKGEQTLFQQQVQHFMVDQKFSKPVIFLENEDNIFVSVLVQGNNNDDSLIELLIDLNSTLSSEYKNRGYEIILLLERVEQAASKNLLEYLKKNTETIKSHYARNSGSTCFIVGGLRARGEYIVDYRYFNLLKNKFTTENNGKDCIYFLEKTNTEPNIVFDPINFYEIAGMTKATIKTVFANMRNVEEYAPLEATIICEQMKVPYTVTKIDQTFEAGILASFQHRFARMKYSLLHSTGLYPVLSCIPK